MSLRFVFFYALLIIHSSTLAAVSINSTCELAPQKTIKGTNIDKRFVIASLSKIFTTQWALERMGSSFQYETLIHLRKNADDSFDVHIKGDGDPTWGREMLHLLASELDKAGVRKIGMLSFDENFYLSWRAKAKVIENISYFYDFTDLAGAETYVPSPEDVRQSLLRHFLPRSSEYLVSLEKAKMAGVEMLEQLHISAPQKVSFLSSEQFSSVPNLTLSLRSLPLLQILKLMNVTSNNYIADMLFLQLGGAAQFNEYLAKSALSKYADSIYLENGSGFPIKNGEVKFYNQSSCASILAALAAMDLTLKQQHLGLENVFPVATSDKSTLDKYELPADMMIAKTGTVNPTIALAGMILTTDGPLFFSQLIKTESSKDWAEARATIRKYLVDLLKTTGTSLHYQNSTPAFWGGGNVTVSTPIP